MSLNFDNIFVEIFDISSSAGVDSTAKTVNISGGAINGEIYLSSGTLNINGDFALSSQVNFSDSANISSTTNLSNTYSLAPQTPATYIDTTTPIVRYSGITPSNVKFSVSGYTVARGGDLSGSYSESNLYLVSNVIVNVRFINKGEILTNYNQTVGKGTVLNVITNTAPVPSQNYEFSNWNNESNGSGTGYEANTSYNFRINGATNLYFYAQYNKVAYTLNITANLDESCESDATLNIVISSNTTNQVFVATLKDGETKTLTGVKEGDYTIECETNFNHVVIKINVFTVNSGTDDSTIEFNMSKPNNDYFYTVAEIKENGEKTMLVQTPKNAQRYIYVINLILLALIVALEYANWKKSFNIQKQ